MSIAGLEVGWVVFVSLKLGARPVSPLGWEHSHSWLIIVFPSRMHALYVSEVVVSQLLNCQVKLVHFNVSEEVVSQLFNEGFPSCGPLGCWSWGS